MRETTRHRIAFNIYWALGPGRSIEALRGELTARGAEYGFRRPPDVRTLYRWSSALRWQQRLDQLEADARGRDRDAHVQAIAEMNERQAREALLLQQKAIEGLQGRSPEAFTPDGLVRALWTAVKVERLARGEPTERSETSTAGDPRLERLSDDDLERLIGEIERSSADGRVAGAEQAAS